jgi:hypothetical protein
MKFAPNLQVRGRDSRRKYQMKYSRRKYQMKYSRRKYQMKTEETMQI